MLHSLTRRVVTYCFGNTSKPALLVLAVAILAPAHAVAQITGQSCNPQLNFTVTTPGPYFLGDPLRVSANLGAGNISGAEPEADKWMRIDTFGFALNCNAGQNFQTCTSAGHTVEFIDIVSTNCVNSNGDPATLLHPESNVIPFKSAGYPIQTGPNETCNVQFDMRLVELNGVTNLVRQSMGWPLPDKPPAVCSNGGVTTASANIAFQIQSCEIDLRKEVSVDGENWFDSDSAEGAPALPMGGDAYYRLIVTNTGTIAYAKPISVVDAALGIDTTIPALAKGESVTLTAAEIGQLTAEGHCEVPGSLQNTASVEAVCRSGDSPVSDSAEDSAFLVCTGTPSIDIEKSTNGEDADTPTGPVIAVGSPVTWTYVVTNDGLLPLTNVAVNDSDLGVITCPATSLEVAESMTCTANGTAVAGQYANTGFVIADAAGGTVTDTDDSHYFGTAAAIGIDKTASPTTYAADGVAVTYTFAVSNTGNVMLTNVGVTDPLPGLGAITCNWAGSSDAGTPAGTLSPGETVSCSAGYTTTQADVDAGQVNNTATAIGTPPTGPNVTDTDPATINSTALPAAIGIDKTASPTTYATDGVNITYTFLVSNNGSVTLTNVGVTDPLPGLGAITCNWAGSSDAGTPAGTLSPGETVSCSAGYTTTQADVDAGQVNNTATATGTPPSGPNVQDNDPETIQTPPDVRSGAIGLNKTADPTTYNAAGESVTYSFLVVNAGNVTLTNVNVVDPLPGMGPISCDWPDSSDAATPAGTLSPDETVTCTASYTTTGADVSAGKVDNTAIATGTPPSGPNVTYIDSATITSTALTDIDVRKEIWNGAAFVDANEATSAPVETWPAGAIYRIVVRNTGAVPLYDVVINDVTLGISNYAPLGTGGAGTLAIGEEVIISSAQNPALEQQSRCASSGAYENVAGASGKSAATDGQVNDTDSAWLTCVGTPALTVKKEISINGGQSWVDGTAGPVDFPSGALYRITVKNTGSVKLVNVTVSDTLIGPPDYVIGELEIDEEVVVTDGEWPALDVAEVCDSSGLIENIVSVTGASDEQASDEVTETDNAKLDCIGPPLIEVKKEVSLDSGATWHDANAEPFPTAVSDPLNPVTALYRITVTNVGGVALTGVVVNDANLGIVDYAPVGTGGAGKLAVDESVVIDNGDLAALSVQNRCATTGEKANVAGADGYSATGGKDEDTDAATVECIGQPAIRITKEVSSDGVNFDDVSASAFVPSDAWYRITVENIGVVDLENVTISDAILGLTDVVVIGAGGPGMLEVGEVVVISHVGGGGDNELADLFVPDLCVTDEEIVNTAIAGGKSVASVQTVTDEDDAFLGCVDSIDLCKNARPTRLKLIYDADDDSDNDQGGLFEATPPSVDFPATPITIKTYNKQPDTTLLGTFTDMSKGDRFYIEDPLKSGKLPPHIVLEFWNGPTLLQTVQFHGGCHDGPLDIGDEFSAATVVGASW